ncbi:MAG: TolC family protein [Phycisphaerae bacterium]|nr:TolC family protein [Phycisphaerae bacterium]
MYKYKTRNGIVMTHPHGGVMRNVTPFKPRVAMADRLFLRASIVVVCCLLGSSGAADSTAAQARTEGEKAGSDIHRQVLSLKEILTQKMPLLPEEVKAEKREVITLNLQECVQKALEHNFNLRISSYNPSVSHSDLIEAEAAFDAVFFGSAQFDLTDRDNIDSGFYTRSTEVNGKIKNQRIGTSPYTDQANHSYMLGLRKRLSTGAVVQLAQQMRRFKDYNDPDLLFRNPFYEFGVQLQVSQPLLRDFGVDVNRASIRAASIQHQISRQMFELEVIKTIAAVETNYWELFFARQRVKVNTQLLERTLQTYEMVQVRSDYDTQSLSVSRTRALIARTRADLISARKNVLQKQELLLQVLNDPNLLLTNKWEIITVDRPDNPELNIEYQRAVDAAVQKRPEIIAQRYSKDIAKLVVDVAKNQKLPRFDLVYQNDMTGAGTNPDQAWDKHWQRDLVSHSIGFSLEMPVGNRGAEAAYHKAKTQKLQEDLRLKSLKEQVLADVNVSVHDLNMTHEEIDVRYESMDADRDEVLYYLATMDAEQQNTMTPNFLNLKLNADERLARSQITTVLSMVQYELAIMNVHRSQGTLLQYNNIKLEDETVKNNNRITPKKMMNTGH